MQQNQLSHATGILWTSQPFSGLAYLIKWKYFTKVFVSYFVNGNPYPPPFTKMPYDAICIIRHFLSFISQSIVIFILLSFPMPKGRRRFQCAKFIPKFFYKLNKYILLKFLVHLKIPN